MTSAIARWHSSARPPSDALELAYADRLEAEMQELAIQLHKRCDEVEALKGQVSQEQELRAVVESCLMERDVAWRKAREKLQEVHAITADISTLLERMQSCQTEMSSRINQDYGTSRLLDVKPQLGAAPEGWQSTLKALGLPELSNLLEECVGEMGKALRSVNVNLERLQGSEKGQPSQKQP